MEKGKIGLGASGGAKRGPKGKGHLPPMISNHLIALGSNSNLTSNAAASSSASVSKIGVKRENPTGVGQFITTKKPKPLPGRSVSGGQMAEHWSGNVIEVEPYELLQSVLDADDCNNEVRVDALLCGAVKQLRTSKLESTMFLTLSYLAKTRPLLFCSDPVVEAFCSLLRPGSKSKPNPLLSVLAANLLLAVYHDEAAWPNTFIEAFIDDSLGERSWVDNEACKGFVDNLITAFSTKMPPKHLMTPEIGPLATVKGALESSACSPSHSVAEDSMDETSSSSLFVSELKEKLGDDIAVMARYSHNQDFVSEYVSDIVNEQLNRRQVPSEINRNVLKLLIATIGVQKVRLIVASKLELWLQNPKLTRPAQDLLLALCLNCNENDGEVVSSLVKMRLKTKPVINHLLVCIKELIGQKEENLAMVMRHAISNELSSSRSANNMQLLSVAFQSAPERATRILAKIFVEHFIKEDSIKPLRSLLREIVRTLRHDYINFTYFVASLTEDNSKFHDIEPSDFVIRERVLVSVADIVSMTVFVSISPTVKESAGKSDKKDVLRAFQTQVSEIQRLYVKWMQFLVPKLFKAERSEFLRCLNKGLLMEPPEQYYNKDNWPPENERNFIFRLSSEVPLQEDTLLRLINMGLSKDHPLSPQEAIELLDALIKRAATVYDESGSFGLIVKNEEIFKLLLKSTSYRIPDNISLPAGYEAPLMAISDWYWKVWSQLLIITAHNPNEFGKLAWDNYPTLSLLIEMCITNHFEFPPPTRQNDDLKSREIQISTKEKQEILQFESHLAAASTKMQINENNSLLLSKLITFDPYGAPRKPPIAFCEQLKAINNALRLGHLLCQSRNPDFLLEIIQRQQKQTLSLQNTAGWTPPSMPWLNELVEMNSDNFAMLPVQCLCEFILGQISDEESISNSQVEPKHSEKVKRKDRRKKFAKMIAYLQNLLKTNSKATKELMDYFMKRLCFQQLSYRMLASKALALILSGVVDGSDVFDLSARNTSVDIWLIDKLTSLKNFESVKNSTCLCLKSAVLVETNPWTVCSYVYFLAEYGESEIREITLSAAHLLIDRQIIVRYMVQEEKLRDKFLSCCLKIFSQYLTARRLRGSDVASPNCQEHILIQWEDKKPLVLNILIVHAMIILLTYGPTEERQVEYDALLDTWFCDPLPKAFIIETTEEALLIPDWLKLKLLKSSNVRLVDAGLRDLEVSQVLLFIQSFGLPVPSMEKLLSQLDSFCEADSETVSSMVTDVKYMRQLVDVQFMRGVTSGRSFKELLRVPQAV